MKQSSPLTRFFAWVFILFLGVAFASSTAAQSSSRSSSRSSNRSSSRSSSSSSSTTNSDGSRAQSTAMIQYDLDTGTIIVVADDETNARIKNVIDSLDQPVPQVLIKVLFLEVTHTDDLDVGVEGALNMIKGDDYHKLSTVFGLANETEGGFYKILDGDLQATIRAMQEKTKLEVLSRPSVLARNNKEASITVGQEVPFITNSRTTDDGSTVNTIQYSDIGIILKVTPHIAPQRMVELKVEPEISTLTADTVPISETVDARVISKRSAETRVCVGDGKTVVIGGMMENNNTQDLKKIPVLGSIPYLGALFRRTITNKSKTELLIFLTPVVVDSPETVQAMTKAERDNAELAPQVFKADDMKKYLDGHGPAAVTDEATSPQAPAVVPVDPVEPVPANP